MADRPARRTDPDVYRRADHGWLTELDERTVHSGDPQQRMGLRLIRPETWLAFDDQAEAELDLRAELVDRRPADVLAAVEGSEPAAREAAEMVHHWLADHHRPALDRWKPHPGGPLVSAGLAVQEDLCVMERVDDQWLFTAGVVCFPTYWRLADKIGRGQETIHQPVAHYQTDLAERVDTFFDRLNPDRIVSRRNWGFSTEPELFAPDRDGLPDGGSFDPTELWFRSERQTLRKLPTTGAVLFTIKVQLTPLTNLSDHPDLARRLLDSIENWSPELWNTRGSSRGWMAAIMTWLSTVGHDDPSTPSRDRGARP